MFTLDCCARQKGPRADFRCRFSLGAAGLENFAAHKDVTRGNQDKHRDAVWHVRLGSWLLYLTDCGPHYFLYISCRRPRGVQQVHRFQAIIMYFKLTKQCVGAYAVLYLRSGGL